MQRLLIVTSALLIKFAMSHPTSNSIIEHRSRYTLQNSMLTDNILSEWQPCDSNGQCTCWIIDKSKTRGEIKNMLVHCDNRNLTKLPKFFMDHRVIILDLSNNALERMPDLTSPGYEYINALELGHNRIKTIEENSISHNLKLLFLEHNLITPVDPRVVNKIIATVMVLRLDNNPLICDCNSTALVRLSKRRHPYWLHPATCDTTGELLKNYKVDKICLHPTASTPIA